MPITVYLFTPIWMVAVGASVRGVANVGDILGNCAEESRKVAKARRFQWKSRTWSFPRGTWRAVVG